VRWGTTASSVATEGVSANADWSAWERDGRAPRSGDGNGWATNAADDAATLASLGLDIHRFTIEWVRLEPRPGAVDPGRVEHERDVLQAVRAAGLSPWVTLHHTSLPGWFADDEGGFRDRKARSYYWARHVDRCAEWFDDLVDAWVPVEDPVGWALRGHLFGTRPPGRRHPEQAHEAVAGALEAAHDAARLLRGTTPVVASLGLPLVRPVDAEARDAARALDRLLWQVPLRALRDGVLDVPGLAQAERPDWRDDVDLVGIVFDHPLTVDAQGVLGPYPAAARVDDTGFAPNTDQLGEAIRRLADELPDRALAITGTGVMTGDDDWRDELVRETVQVVRGAVADGIDLEVCLFDTGIDGYEWNAGFDGHRGLVARDRSIRTSGRSLQMLIAPPDD